MKRKQLTRFFGPLTESQDQNLALTGLCVTYSLDIQDSHTTMLSNLQYVKCGLRNGTWEVGPTVVGWAPFRRQRERQRGPPPRETTPSAATALTRPVTTSEFDHVEWRQGHWA